MENASKAIIIAGGVFISMAIIAIAMFFFTNASQFARTNEEILNSSQITSFNRFYTSYQDGYNPGGVTEIKCIDALNILNRAVEDEIGINVSSRVITKSGDTYVADSKNYTTKKLKYSIEYISGVGIVGGVKITD